MNKKIVIKSCRSNCPYFAEAIQFIGRCRQIGFNGKVIYRADICDKKFPDWCPLEDNK